MTDASYAELLEAKVELNLSDFREKLIAADGMLDAIAASPDVTEEGIGFMNAGDAMIDAAIDQMGVFVNEVMMRSRVQVPKDTETLMNSARPLISEGGIRDVTPEDEMVSPMLNGNRVVVTFGYGYGSEPNPNTKRIAAQYALPVHEIYEAAHEPPTKSHYLIDPLLEAAPMFGSELAMAMQGRSRINSTRLKWARVVEGYINPKVFLFRKGGGPGVPAVFGEGGIQKRRAHEPGWKRGIRKGRKK